MFAEQLADTWRIHARINLYLLDSIPEEAFMAAPPAKGRSFVQMFAHIHNVRLMWLQASAPQHLGELQKIARNNSVDRASLHVVLQGSAQAVDMLLADSLASGRRVKGFKPHAAAFLGYLISHESYHHGEIGIALSTLGFPLDKKIAYGIWEWGVR